MFESLQGAIRGCSIDPGQGGVFLVSEDSATASGALLTFFLTSSVHSNRPVCVVALHNTLGHHLNVCNKVGCNLRQQCDLGNVVVVEGLSLLTDVIDSAGSDNTDHPFQFIFNPTKYPLKNLYNLIRQSVQPWIDQKKAVQIIIEDLSSLLNFGVRTQDIEVFVNYCWRLVGGQQGDGSLVVTTRCDEKDEDSLHLTSALTHLAAATFTLRGLRTGASREVHGDLKIAARPSHRPDSCLPLVHHYQYKVEERTIRLFAPGTSASVL